MPRLLRPAAAVATTLTLAFAGVVVAGPASAATLIVSNNNDLGAGSLRAALTTASSNGVPDTIEFTAGLGVISLTSGPIAISGAEAVTIDGTGSPLIELGAATPFMFTVNMAGDLDLNDLELDGNGLGGGFAISTVGDLTVADTSFSGFSTTDEGGAIGALVVTGDVDITGSAFENNSAVDPGGAIYLGDVTGAVTIDDTFFVENSSDSTGGAVFGNDIGSLTITDGEFSLNTAALSGGAIAFNGIAGTGLIEASTFIGNTAGTAGNNQTQGGAIYLAQVGTGLTFTIRTTEVVDNLLIPGTIDPGGGGLFVDQIDGTLLVDSSTFALNQIISGSGASGLSIGVCDVTASGLLRLIDSTSDESSTDPIYNIDVCTNSGGVELLYSTFVGPRILRIGTNGGPGALVSSSIIDGNSAGFNALSVDGAPILVEWSTVSTAPGVFNVTAGSGVQFNVTDPKLGPLQDNGGLTRTRLLLAGSPALDMGNPAVSGAPSVDQRGSGYPRIIGGRIDIGAIEMPRTLPATGTEIPLPLLIGGVLLVVVGAGALIIARIRRRA